ncbi:MAG: hypothetical protein H6557_31040 [Lewinellaceae bacterium]|nr:hypothetical protein [Phaeodactylibacter sp.]MCB9041087.1 hypothetical protein [Lewinellaceae bacterium]
MRKQAFHLIGLLALSLFPLLGNAQISGQYPLLTTNKNNGYEPGVGKLPVEEGNILGQFQMRGWIPDGGYEPGVEIRSVITGPVQNDGFPANMLFSTGYPGLATRMAITADGNVGIGTEEPDFNLHVVGNTHTSGNFYGRIHFDDNASADNPPSAYTDEAYFELHQLSGFATAPASTTTDGGLFTLAPGGASNDHQLFFADDGIFHRREAAGAGNWANPWAKLLSSADINGTPNRVAKFTGPNTLGDSHIYDDGARIGIRTNAPDPAFDVDIKGNTKADGGLTVSNHAVIGATLTIGSTPIPAGYRLSVDGNVICEEVRVLLSPSWPDYVFEKDYRLMPLEEVEASIQKQGHLPGVPSAEVIGKAGLAVGEITANQQEKIEEAFLHMIEMNKQLKQLQEENAGMKARLEKLEGK